MKETKKRMSWLLAAGMAVVLMAGCGGGKENSGGAPSSSNASSSSSPSSSAPAEKPPLKALLHYATTDFNGSTPAVLLEKGTGYKVQYDMLPQDKPEDKLNIIMGSGESYDIISMGSVYKQLYFDYAKRGALVDLTPLIEQYGPNIKAAVSQKNLDAVKVDGKIYSIPSEAITNTSWSIAIRVDWLEKLGLPMPTTLDELVDVLKAFKEQDPGGNGDKNIPLTAMGGVPLENIRGAFGLAQSWSDVDGRLVNMAENPALKDYMAFVNELYKGGLLDKEFVTTKEATMLEKFASGRAGAMIAAWHMFPTISTAIVKSDPNAKVAFAGALTGKDGTAGLALSEGFELFTVVPKSAKHPEEAIKWINAKLEPKVFLESYLGEEGVHYSVQDGNYYPILPQFTDEMGNANNMRTGVIEDKAPTYWQARVRKDELLFQGWETINTIPEEHKIHDLLAYSPFLPELAKNNAQLNTLLNDYITKTVVNGDAEATYDEFVNNWKAAGGEAVTQEVNDWYATTK
ncbi:extracellular solute-binding protein [Cohnella cellulosilytica]|uniref:Extracellular solute-binding protein n=1 Tax=Cohnella cellulosilytica TaxID=986710 RepID=A0ABW2FKV2_9BACL